MLMASQTQEVCRSIEFSSKNSISDYKLWLHSDIHGTGRFSAPYNHHPLYHTQTQTPSTVPDTNGRFPQVFKLREGKTEVYFWVVGFHNTILSSSPVVSKHNSPWQDPRMSVPNAKRL
nr:hypothetical protein Itr_chr13CG15800 [Ipomoea trifida]